MNYRLIQLARSFALGMPMAMVLGGFTACTDDYDLDDEGNYPSWLGGSIYEALKNPEALSNSDAEVLSGTFDKYLRLIDDLGYAETLAKTGSKTVFPANDEAFERFFANNQWNVTCYEDLTEAMKKQLLYGSMLDNALQVEMLSNISDGSTAVTQGQALRHTTSANVIDTITFLKGKELLPANNSYWEKFYDKGIHMVMDATRPMMVHFTEEQMTANGITTKNANSDFEVLTGMPYDSEERSAYIFRNKIIHKDVTCKNGYIHQMQDVLVPPGNLAEVIRTNGNSSLFSRMLDRFSAPYYDASTTKNYNDYAQANNLPLIDSIYQKRYMSSRSEGGVLNRDPNNAAAVGILPFDPGWNNYSAASSSNISDVAAMFVPTDEALENYFLPGGEGEFLINIYGVKENGVVLNDKEHLTANIDSIPLENISSIVGNLMQPSFLGSVPSKFDHVMDEANDPMGLNLDIINRTAEGNYDVKIANNGVAYMITKMFAPPSLIAVSAPVKLSSNMRVMNEAVNDGDDSHNVLKLNLNYYAYLLAMSANYAFFIPTDPAFAQYYVDPASLNSNQPRALKFYYDTRTKSLVCSQWKYDKTTHTVQTAQRADSLGMVTAENFRTQLTDILNYHTVVLGDNEKLGDNGNKFFKTKHGGAICFENGQVKSGAQIEGVAPVSNVTQVYQQANGVAYAIDHVIEAPQLSVLDVLQADQFSEFLALCNDFDMDLLLDFASDRMKEVNTVTKKQRKEAYKTFVDRNGLTDNVNYFNSYNYTVYAPDNAAMQAAYDRGLPRWSDIKAIYEPFADEFAAGQPYSDELIQARNKVLAMVEEINAFIRYHFQDNSVYADKVVEAGIYPTACSDTLGIREKLTVSGGGDRIVVTDKRGHEVTIDATNDQKVSNQMVREYIINGAPSSRNRSISTSSFAVVHQISTPLSPHADTDRYDAIWSGAGARERLAAYRQQYERKLYKRY